MSSPSTQQKILAAARGCFFQHGYKASNMSMISEYSSFSRATVHKHFKNKDVLFRQLCRQVQQQSNAASATILEQQNQMPSWQAIETILSIWLKPTFEEVSDQIVLRDLKFHAQIVAEDIFNDAHDDLTRSIEMLIEQGIKHGEIDLQKMALDSRMLSRLIVAGLDGLRGHFETKDVQEGVAHLLAVFKQATLP